MGPKVPTATPTVPSFETPYLETILPCSSSPLLLPLSW